MNKIQEIVEQVRRIAAEHPDFVYEQVAIKGDPCEEGIKCLYIGPDGKGSCIIGQGILAVDGNAYNSLAHYDTQFLGVSAAGVMERLYPEEAEDNKELVWWLTRVQMQQDRAATWGEAVEYADSLIGEPVVF